MSSKEDKFNIFVEEFNYVDILHSKYFEYYKMKEVFRKYKNQFKEIVKQNEELFEPAPIPENIPPEDIIDCEDADLGDIMKENDNSEEKKEDEQEPASPRGKKSKKKDINEYESNKLKKLFRKISMKTHPDKVKDKKLNRIFLSAKKYYEKGNLVKMLILTKIVNIKEEQEDKDIEIIRSGIKQYDGKINEMESSVIWKWGNMSEEERKKFYNLNKQYFKDDLFD